MCKFAHDRKTQLGYIQSTN